ncbi:hypothetical protein EV175_004058 [Coemansia sp. RSA 1933]|nr:hypothetical protein EV175_004058 [Coemansia sp. RSA 1933]
MGRAESETVSSQATPPPVEGLPRLSSSPAPGYGMLHTSSLTSSGYRRTASAAYDPVHAAAESAAAEEKREVRVTKINALLNDESPTESHQSAMATDWFGTSVKEEEDATGMAALALAAMMGGGRTPTPTGQASGGGVATVAAPQQQAGLLYPQHHQQQQARHSLSVMQPPLQQHHHHYHARQSPMLGHRLPADPYAGGSNIIGAVSSVSGSAFSPIAARAHGSPMAISPPPPPHGMHQHYHHLQARPSSVGPVAATYHGQHSGGVHSAGGSPAIPSYSREMTPPQRMAVRQRKPSAPPLPPPGGGAAYVRASGRSSVSSSYAPYNVAQHQQQQMPGVVGRVAYASPSIQQQQMPPYSDGGRYGATGYVEQPSHGHYTQQQQQQQQQHSAPGGAPPYYYQQHPSPSANNPQPPPQYR